MPQGTQSNTKYKVQFLWAFYGNQTYYYTLPDRLLCFSFRFLDVTEIDGEVLYFDTVEPHCLGSTFRVGNLVLVDFASDLTITAVTDTAGDFRAVLHPSFHRGYHRLDTLGKLDHRRPADLEVISFF